MVFSDSYFMHMCRCTWMHVHIETGISLRYCTSGVPLFFLLKTGSLSGLELIKWTNLHGESTPDNQLSPHPQHWDASAHGHTSFFYKGSRKKPWNSVFLRQLISPDLLHSFESLKMIHFSKSCVNVHFSLEQVSLLIKLQHTLYRWPY